MRCDARVVDHLWTTDGPPKTGRWSTISRLAPSSYGDVDHMDHLTSDRGPYKLWEPRYFFTSTLPAIPPEFEATDVSISGPCGPRGVKVLQALKMPWTTRWSIGGPFRLLGGPRRAVRTVNSRLDGGRHSRLHWLREGLTT